MQQIRNASRRQSGIKAGSEAIEFDSSSRPMMITLILHSADNICETTLPPSRSTAGLDVDRGSGLVGYILRDDDYAREQPLS